MTWYTIEIVQNYYRKVTFTQDTELSYDDFYNKIEKEFENEDFNKLLAGASLVEESYEIYIDEAD
jgi:hypothetical protein